MGSSQTIAVLDYGMGNLHSVAKALEHVAPKARVLITESAEEITGADRVVFPGVGAIRDCMAEIRNRGFDRLVAEAVAEKPVLGICVGMQALMEHSDENNGVACLGILPGRVRFFGKQLHDADGQQLKVPHMGWNQVHQTVDHPVWQDIAQDSRFYFVHSYYVEAVGIAGSEDIVAATCDYGVRIAAALAKGNLFAVQFHPEKSHEAGLKLLRNFVAWQPGSL